MKTRVTFAQPSKIKSLEDFKNMLNDFSTSLLGKPIDFSEDEWQERYNAFIAKKSEAKKRKSAERKRKIRE